MSKVKVGNDRILEKIVRIHDSMTYLMPQIENGNEFLVGLLSVELRKLLGTKQGDDLMKRMEKMKGVKFEITINIDHPFLKPEKIGIDGFRNQMIFAISGRSFTRLELILIVANQEGAHLDEEEDEVIPFSENVVFAVGSQGKLKKPISQKSLYIVETAKVLMTFIERHVLPIGSR